MLILETGQGLSNANSLASVAEADVYWVDRGGRADWADVRAFANLLLAEQPTANETLTIGTKTYIFKSTVVSANEVLIGSTLAKTQQALVHAINTTGAEGEEYGAATTINADVEAADFEDNVCVLTARVAGVGGNEIIISDTFASGNNGVEQGTLLKGADSRSPALVRATDYVKRKYAGQWRGIKKVVTQALPFPRTALYDEESTLLSDVTVPTRVKEAIIELAARANVEPLLVDETTPGGLKSDRVKIGPIETEQVFIGSSGTQTRYTSTEQSLRGLLKATRTVDRA